MGRKKGKEGSTIKGGLGSHRILPFNLHED